MKTPQDVTNTVNYYRTKLVEIANDTEQELDVRLEALDIVGETSTDTCVNSEAINLIIEAWFEIRKNDWGVDRYRCVSLLDELFGAVFDRYTPPGEVFCEDHMGEIFKTVDWRTLMCEYDTEEFKSWQEYVDSCEVFYLTQVLLSGHKAFTVDW